MSDVWADPLYLQAHDRAVDRENEQREWEADDTRILPKPARRYRATKDEWIEFHEWRSEQTCWVCHSARATNTHHIYPRGQGGDDYIENLAPLCGTGTTGCHGRIHARDLVARSLLRQSMTSDNLAYLIHKLGDGPAAAWLERHYPERVSS